MYTSGLRRDQQDGGVNQTVNMRGIFLRQLELVVRMARAVNAEILLLVPQEGLMLELCTQSRAYHFLRPSSIDCSAELELFLNGEKIKPVLVSELQAKTEQIRTNLQQSRESRRQSGGEGVSDEKFSDISDIEMPQQGPDSKEVLRRLSGSSNGPALEPPTGAAHPQSASFPSSNTAPTMPAGPALVAALGQQLCGKPYWQLRNLVKAEKRHNLRGNHFIEKMMERVDEAEKMVGTFRKSTDADAFGFCGLGCKVN